MKKIILLAACLGITAVGCTTGAYTVIGSKRPAISPALVQIYAVAPTNSVVVGFVTASALGVSQMFMDSIISKLKDKAALIGANGILIGSGSLQPDGGGGRNATAQALYVP